MVDPAVAAQRTAPEPPRVTPTVSQDVRTDWGSWFSQFAAHEEPVLVALAEAGIHVGLKSVPMGPFVEMFLGPKLVKQYVDMAITALNGFVSHAGQITAPPDTIYATVLNLLNANEPAFVAFVEGKLDPMVKDALAKIGINI